MIENLMLVGDVAKRLGISVRTLQYYDKEKLCSPSAYSEGGRRLYSNKDIVKLHQILSMKYLGLSLNQIKNDLPKIESADDVIQMLKAQGVQITQQIDNLIEIQNAINKLIEEVELINIVDWSKYASIVDMIRNDVGYYWVVKHFENKTILNAADRFDKKSAAKFVSKIEEVWDKFNFFIESEIAPDSEQSIALAKEMWDMIIKFSGGDKDILKDTLNFGQSIDTWKNEEWKNKFSKIQEYCEKALEYYFIKYNIEVDI